MEEYKGIYYGDESERKFFEGGAHFKYNKLYKILEKLAKERNSKEKENEKELFVHKKNKLSNSLNQRIGKDKKTRNIISYLDKNKISFNTTSINQNNNRNDSFNFNQFQTYLSINKNKTKNKIKKDFSLNNQKKIDPTRNKDSNLLFKGRPNTILKDELQKLLFSRNNHLISSSMEKKYKSKNKYSLHQNNKRSLPDLNYMDIDIKNKLNNYFKKNKLININKSNNNIKNENISLNGVQTNISYFETNRIGFKTERFNNFDEPAEIEKISEKCNDISDNKNKSQNYINQIKYNNSLGITKKEKAKINKKNSINDNKNKVNGRTRSNINSDVPKKIMEHFTNIKKDTFKNKEKKEITINRTNRKKNIKTNFIIHNGFLTKTNFNNHLKKNSNKKIASTKKLDNNIFTKININKLSFNHYIGKSRNTNGKENKLLNKDSYLNSTNKYRNYFKTMIDIDKLNNNKSNNKILLNQINNKKNLNINDITKNSQNYKNNNTEIMNKSTPRVNKKLYNKVSSASSNINGFAKTKIIIKPYKQIKANNGFKKGLNRNNNIKIEHNISNYNNNYDNNKSINNNIMNNTCVYIKPKQSQCCLQKNSYNKKNININKVNNNRSVNYTQKPTVRKKKAIIKFKI